MRTARRFGTALGLALIGCALALPAAARERLDLVKLKNGDSVHGEIIGLESATLVVRTVSLGTVEIDWPDIAGLESPQLFEIELTSGRRLVGHLESDAPAGSLVLGSGAGELAPAGSGAADEPKAPPVPLASAAAVRSFALAEIVGIRQRGATLWQSHRGYLDAGFNLAGGKDYSEATVDFELAMRGPRMRWANDLTVSIRDDAGLPERQRWNARSLFEFPAGRHWLWAVAGVFQRNDDLDLEARETAHAGAYWIATRSAKGRMLLGGGLAESHERYQGESAANEVTSAMFVLGGDYDRFRAHSTHASFEILYLPTLNDDGRYRVDAQATLRQKIARDFTISLSPYYTFDSAPPREGLLAEDWGLTSSIGWLF